MKKILAFAAVVAAVSFAACTGNKTANTSEPDSLCTEECCEQKGECAMGAADGIIASLTEAISKTDAESVKSIASKVAETVAAFIAKGDEEAAKKYTAIISNFVVENYEKLQSFGAADIISNAIAGVQGLPSDIVNIAADAAKGVKNDALSSIISAITGKANEAKEATEAAADAANQAVSDAAAAVEAAPEAAKEAAKEAAGQAIDNAAAAAKDKLGL